MIDIPDRSQPPTIRCVSGTLLSLVLLLTRRFSPRGHGKTFRGKPVQPPTQSKSMQKTKTAGIKVEPVNRQQLAMGIKTTGQIVQQTRK